MNGITGANQNYETYWQRVKLAFDERKIVDPYFNKTVMIRDNKAMSTHWGIMQAVCSKWHGIQEELEACPVSGADFEAKVCSLAMPSVDPGSPKGYRRPSTNAGLTQGRTPPGGMTSTTRGGRRCSPTRASGSSC
jgi:hypothetical protein